MIAVLEEVVSRTARYYAGRVRWAELEELESEGWVAAMEVARVWKESHGCLKHYAGACVRRRIAGYLLQAGSPVSAKRHDRASLRGLSAVPLVERHGGSEEAAAEEALAEESWRLEVGRCLRAVAERTNSLGALDAELGARKKDAGRYDLAKRRLVYRAQRDRALRSLWKERQR